MLTSQGSGAGAPLLGQHQKAQEAVCRCASQDTVGQRGHCAFFQGWLPHVIKGKIGKQHLPIA